jgi:hypothetical protein
MESLRFRGTPHNGKFVFEDKDRFIQALSQREGVPCELVLRDICHPNSLAQQRYYRKVVVKYIAEAMGESDTQYVHETIADMFFEELVSVDGKEQWITKSTALGNWSTVEWELKMQEVRNWAREFLNIEIPLPNEICFD